MAFQLCFAFLILIILIFKCTYTCLYFYSIGGGAPLDFDALCDNDDTAIAAFMNYLEAEGGLVDPEDFSDIPWTLQHLNFKMRTVLQHFLYKKLYVLLYCIDTIFILYSYESSTNFYRFSPIFTGVWGNGMFSFKQNCSEFSADPFTQPTGFKPTSCYFLLNYF